MSPVRYNPKTSTSTSLAGRWIGSTLLAMSIVSLPATAAPLERMGSTPRTVAPGEHPAGARGHLSAVAARDDVQRQLRELGLSADEAEKRIAALSDAEVAALDGKIASLPAGGDSSITIGIGSAIIIALLLIIFL